MAWLQQIYTRATSSLWFIPGLIVAAAVALAAVLVYLDGVVNDELLNRWPRLFGAGADGSRGMLTAIATSMITVAGVVFSITIVALSMASNQFSPRLLRTFMRSTITQVVLGVFVGIFAYCLVVLRTIRGGDEQPFVPAVAVLVAVILALVGVGFLVFFIHHIATSIQVTTLMDEIRRDTLAAVDRLFPDDLGEEDDDDQPPAALADARWTVIPARHTGYLQAVENAQLLQLAREFNTTLRIEPTIGAFLAEGWPLVSIPAGAEPSDELAERLNRLFIVDRWRTIHQDAAFGIQLLVDMALRALSPGINDSTTAVNCVDHVSAILAHAGRRRIPSPYRYDEGELRVIAQGPTFQTLVQDALEPIRRRADVETLGRMIEAIGTLLPLVAGSRRREVLGEQLTRLAEAVQERVHSPHDQAALLLKIERLRPLVRPLDQA